MLLACVLTRLFRSRARLEAEILVLRHQLNILQRKSTERAAFKSIDRLVFAGLYRLVPGVLDALKILKPETVIRWHRAGFRAYWRWKSRSRGGRPKTPLEVRQLIRDMSIENPLGCSADSWRTAQARHRCRANHRCQVHGARKASAIPRMEDVSSKSRGRNRVDGFVRGPHDLVPAVVWISGPAAFPP